MLLAVEGLGLTAARSRKTRLDARRGRVVSEVSRQSSPSVQDARETTSFFFFPQVAFTNPLLEVERLLASSSRVLSCAVLCRRAGSACDAMRRPSRVVGPAGANMELSKTRATCFEVENTLSGKMRLKGKRTKWR